MNRLSVGLSVWSVGDWRGKEGEGSFGIDSSELQEV